VLAAAKAASSRRIDFSWGSGAFESGAKATVAATERSVREMTQGLRLREASEKAPKTGANPSTRSEDRLVATE
jgi:hypothetical protein